MAVASRLALRSPIEHLHQQFQQAAIDYAGAKLQHFFGYRSKPFSTDEIDALRQWWIVPGKRLVELSRCAMNQQECEWFYFWGCQDISLERAAQGAFHKLAVRACEVFPEVTIYTPIMLTDNPLEVQKPTTTARWVRALIERFGCGVQTAPADPMQQRLYKSFGFPYSVFDRCFKVWGDESLFSLSAQACESFSQPAKASKRPPGRPVDTDKGNDERIFDAWNTGSYQAYADLAAAFGIDRAAATRAIDRERKRRNKSRQAD